MKLSLTFLSLCVVSISAALSAEESKAPTKDAQPTASNQPTKTFLGLPSFDIESLLTSGPIASLIAKTGVNITQRLADAKAKAGETGWDPRIPMITDENYRELIFEEPLSLEELDERVWFLLVSVPNADPVSKFVDEKFDATYAITQSDPEKALPKVKWGRINYLDVTELTTRWWIWKAPMLVISRKGGQELRFYTPQQIRLVPEVLHRFLEVDGWKETEPWSGYLAPGGTAEPYMEYVSKWAAKGYIYTSTVPKWLMLVATGLLASLLLQIMHRGSPTEHPGRSTVPKHARISNNAKTNDGGNAVKPVRKDMSPSPSGRTGSPTRQSARLQAKKS